MANCRIYLFTYKRNELFKRAVESIIKQTFTNWVCEVHNDCPEDLFPDEYIKSLNDKRFIIENHTKNLGAVESFNFAFLGCKEEFVSILEDDNWWEPTFLAEMISGLKINPTVNVSWSNMNLWEEREDGTWRNLHQKTFPNEKNDISFPWPSPAQSMSALHSNSALVYRGKNAKNYHVPNKSLLNAVELIRERSFEHPIYLNTKPLVNFAITLKTNRTNDPYIWITTQIMLLASFIQTSENPNKAFCDNLKYHRVQSPNPVANFFLCNLFFIKSPELYKRFNFKDWFFISKWFIKNGVKLNFMKRYIKEQQDIYKYLILETAKRYKELKKT